MGALDTLKNLLGKDKEKELQQAYEQGQSNPSIIPTSPAESAQTLQMLGQNNSSTFELGQLALDPDEDIEQFKSFLRGYRIVPTEKPDGRIVYEKVDTGEALMNDKGVNAVAGSLRNYMGKSIILTNFTSGSDGAGDKTDKAIKVIKNRCKHASINMIATLTLKRAEWGIDEISRGQILNHYCDIVEASYYRSLDDGERKKYYNTVKQVQHTNQQQNMNDTKKRGWFGA